MSVDNRYWLQPSLIRDCKNIWNLLNSMWVFDVLRRWFAEVVLTKNTIPFLFHTFSPWRKSNNNSRKSQKRLLLTIFKNFLTNFFKISHDRIQNCCSIKQSYLQSISLLANFNYFASLFISHPTTESPHMENSFPFANEHLVNDGLQLIKFHRIRFPGDGLLI